MSRNKDFDCLAFVIVAVSLLMPLLLPFPGSALQHHTIVHRRVISNNVVQKLQQEGNFRFFLQALRASGMQGVLETNKGPYTIFAPNDRAFSSLSTSTFKRLFEDKNRLKNIVKYHIVPKRVLTTNVKFDALKTMTGDFLMTNINNQHQVSVSGAVVTKGDISCRNGIVHSIDAVLFPLTGMETLAMNENSMETNQ
ncbi:MAG: hypothetical protein C0507_04590 [Cyanobacteria bacterium PR.3.49]|jgi:uncharacterized surface protein with fasciclin (FAS1) repeats|nr:hypothetical protein [Cyanobacteria bacterium PR.3.49]